MEKKYVDLTKERSNLLSIIGRETILFPEKLIVLSGYATPDYSGEQNGYGKFQAWIKKTMQTKDETTIRNSIQHLDLQLKYYDFLHSQKDFYSKEARIVGRIKEGLNELNSSNILRK